MSEYEERAAAARQTGKQFGISRCAKNYNTVVLPKPGGWQVYMVPGATENDIILVGGAYRIDTDASGRTITASRAFSKSCISLEKTLDTEAFTRSHLLDPQPTEMHVFWRLLGRKPIYLITTQNSLVWLIEKGHTRPAEKIDAKN